MTHEQETGGAGRSARLWAYPVLGCLLCLSTAPLLAALWQEVHTTRLGQQSNAAQTALGPSAIGMDADAVLGSQSPVGAGHAVAEHEAAAPSGGLNWVRAVIQRLRTEPPGQARLKQWHDRVRISMLRSSPNPKVVVGADKDWLFFMPAGIGLPAYTHQRPFSSAELEHWRRFVEQRVAWFAARGVQYVMVVAPNKSAVYADQVPGRLAQFANPGRLDQLLAVLQPATREHVIDLRGVLREQAAIVQNYYRLDSHWNDRGAYRAYQYMLKRIRSLSLQGPAPLPKSWAVPVQTLSQWEPLAERHDLAALLNDPEFLQEGTLRLTPRVSSYEQELIPLSQLTRLRDPGLATSSRFYPRLLRQKGRASEALPTCVAFRDSFFHALTPFIAQHCRSLSLLKHPDKPGVPALEIDVPYLAKVRPHVVIEQFVDRLFYRAHNGAPRLLDELAEQQFPMGVPTKAVPRIAHSTTDVLH